MKINNEMLELANESIAQAYTAKSLGFLNSKEDIDRHVGMLEVMLGNDEDLDVSIRNAVEYIRK